MSSEFVYLIQVLGASALMFLFYLLLLKNTTFFRLNRMYLLASLVLPLVLPLITFPLAFISQDYSVPSLISEIVIFPENTYDSAQAGFYDYLIWGYLAITAILALRFLVGLVVIFVIRLKGKKVSYQGLTVVITQKPVTPFSVFRTVFVNISQASDDSLNQIITHEKVHAGQGHSYDSFLAELVCVFFWMNPFAWKIKESLKSTHEYLADDEVREQGFDLAGYFLLLFNNVVGMRFGLANNFNQSLTLKRMQMMKRNRSPRHARWLYLMSLPLVALLFVVISCQEKDGSFTMPSDTDLTKKVVDETQPLGGSEVYEVADVMPTFGSDDAALMNYLISEIKYPKEAKESGIQGKVIVSFVVLENGTVSEVKVEQAVSPQLDAEAVRVISAMPAWNPGKIKGKNVKVKLMLPINFKLAPK
jgi:TonB family protein